MCSISIQPFKIRDAIFLANCHELSQLGNLVVMRCYQKLSQALVWHIMGVTVLIQALSPLNTKLCFEAAWGVVDAWTKS